MARAKRNKPDDVELANLPPLDSSVAPPPLALSPVSELEQRTDREIDEVLAEIGGAAQVRIARVNPETGGRAHVGTLQAEGFNLDALLDAYGGGRYYLVVKVGRDEAWRGFVEVDPSVPPKNPRVKAVASPNGNGVASPNNFLEQMGSVMATMMQSQAAGVTMMQQLMALQASGNAQMIQALTAALGAKKETDPIETLRAAAEIFARSHPDESKAGGVEEMLKLFREGMELGRKVAGGADEPSWLGVVAEGVRGVTAVMQGAGRTDSAPSVSPVTVRPPGGLLEAPRANVPPPTTPQPAAPAREVAMAMERPWLVAAKSQLAQLRGFALTGVDPSAVVELISKTAPEIVFDDFLNYYEEAPATFVDRFKAELSDIAQLGEWGDAFVGELGRLAADVIAETGSGTEDEGQSDAPAASA